MERVEGHVTGEGGEWGHEAAHRVVEGGLLLQIIATLPSESSYK